MPGSDNSNHRRLLIVNGDDFGLSADVNRGIVQAHETGIVSSASLMVGAPAAAQAAAYARARSELSVGLHVDLGCWILQDGEWQQLYHVVDTEDARAVSDEIARQLDRFVSLCGRPPTHIDSHQHVHLDDPARSVLLEVARERNVPLRSLTPGIEYCGSYYGQNREGSPNHSAIRIEALIGILKTLPPGLTELGCHPGLGSDIGDPVYSREREMEVQALCDSRVRDCLAAEGIELRSFGEAAASWWTREGA